jgi:hypothetical protein
MKPLGDHDRGGLPMTESLPGAHDRLEDVCFLLPFSLDCRQRLDNLHAVTTWLGHHFDGPIFIGGHDLDDIGPLPAENVKLVPVRRRPDGRWRGAEVRNALADVAQRTTNPSIVALWDVDVWCSPSQVVGAAETLRKHEADFVYPYDGRFVHVDGKGAAPLRDCTRRAAGTFDPPKAEHLGPVHSDDSVGGAVLFDAETYRNGGRDNDSLSDWGPDDRERFHRFRDMGFRCARVDGPLFHLDHDRPHERYYGNANFDAEGRLLPEFSEQAAIAPYSENCPVCRTTSATDENTQVDLGRR